MHEASLKWAGTLLVAVAVVSGMVAPAHAQCLVAVAADDGSGPNEIAELHNTLGEIGCAWVDVTSVAEARTANADVLIDRYGAGNFPSADIDAWLADGFGYIEMGDWPDWFADAWEGQPAGTPLAITVVDAGHPLTAGLPPSWTGRGFWAYDWASDALGYVTDAGFPNLIEGSYGTVRARAVTGDDVGPGRAVYIGFNTYGSVAGAADKLVLRNAIAWSGRVLEQIDAIPTLGTTGIVAFVLLLGVVGVVVLFRLYR